MTRIGAVMNGFVVRNGIAGADLSCGTENTAIPTTNARQPQDESAHNSAPRMSSDARRHTFFHAGCLAIMPVAASRASRSSRPCVRVKKRVMPARTSSYILSVPSA